MSRSSFTPQKRRFPPASSASGWSDRPSDGESTPKSDRLPGTIGGGANVVYGYPSHIGKHMDVTDLAGDSGGIEVVPATEGIEAAIIRGEKIGQNPLPAGMCDQDVDLSDGHRRVANLGEIVKHLSDHLRCKTRDRHEDLSPRLHPCYPSASPAAVVAGVSSQYGEV